MDKYGIINLTELEKIIDITNQRRTESKNNSFRVVCSSAVVAYKNIAERCSKLPSAEDCFYAARSYETQSASTYPTFEDYITNYKS